MKSYLFLTFLLLVYLDIFIPLENMDLKKKLAISKYFSARRTVLLHLLPHHIGQTSTAAGTWSSLHELREVNSLVTELFANVVYCYCFFFKSVFIACAIYVL